jgi:hypothetical protein
MIKRDFLKLFGAGLASLPFAGKLLREGLPEIKSAAKGIARTLSKVEGMPEWFSPLVNKILKNGKNISPEVKRLEDTVHVRTLKDGDTVFTLTEHPLEGEIRVEIKSPRNPHGEPVELQYKKPKKDFDPDTGKTINEPGEFQVVESEPRWTNSNDPVLELGERVTSVDKAAGDIEAAERAVTGKIKNREKIKERRKIKDQMENNPTDYIDQEYGPEPGFYQQFKNYGDYAEGGIAGYQYGGKAKNKLKNDEDENEIKEEDILSIFGQKLAGPVKGELFLEPVEKQRATILPESGGTRELREYVKQQTPKGVGIGYSGPDYGLMAVKPLFNEMDKRPLVQGYYKAGEDKFIRGSVGPKEQRLNYSLGDYSPNDEGTSGMDIGFSRNTQMGRPEYMFNVGARFANGGLTRTIPPVRGPMPQGVETLFKRRYR